VGPRVGRLNGGGRDTPGAVMAKRKGSDGESKTGLIVSLVFFVLTSIILGVMAYSGFAGQTELMDQAKKAKADEKAAKLSRDEMQSRLLALRVAIGIDRTEGENSDQKTLTGLRQQVASINQAAQDEIAALDKKFKDKGIAWDEKAGKTTKSLAEAVDDAQLAQGNAEKQRDEAVKNFEDAKATFEEESKKKDARVAKALEDLKKVEASKKEIADQKSAEYLAAMAKINDLGKAIDLQKKEKAEFEASVKKDRAVLDARIGDLNIKNQRLEVIANDKRPNVLDFDRPKGQIIYINRAQREVDINLGSADNVKPQLTFSVLSPDAVGKGAASKERKAAVEVVRVIGPHQSVAKYTETAGTRDPIMKGDLLYNPAWNKTLREHIALIGVIDLNGDGLDDTPEFMRALEKQGVIVDAYLDLRDLQMKGPGLSEKTSYLVTGDNPDLSEAISIAGRETKRDARLKEVSEVMGKVKSQAKDLGIFPIPAQRFMALIGFEVPKSITPPDYASPRYTARQAAPAADEKGK
jgi:hypothetical protein